MQVILLDDVPKLGDMGQIVKVKPGYARNYLIPQKLALRASTGNLAQLEHQKQRIESQRVKMRKAALDVHQQIDQLSVTIPKKAGENDKLFGSVTNRDIAAALQALGHEVNSKRIDLDNPIKELGIYSIRIKLHSDVQSSVRVWVVAI